MDFFYPIYESILKYTAVFAASFTLSCFATWLVQKFATQYKFCLDIPSERSVHTKPVPRCGGIAVSAAILLSVYLITSYFSGDVSSNLYTDTWLFSFAIGAFLITAVGLFDDIRGLSPHIKLGCQIAIAGLAFLLGIKVQHILGVQLPVWIDLPLTVFWFIAIINAFNLIDGLDGLATSLSIICFFTLALMSFHLRVPENTLLMLAFIGCSLGFLRFNFFPAKIFLGDSGSMFLGYCIAALSLSTNNKSSTLVTLGTVLFAASIPFFDTFLAIWRRSVKKALSKPSDEADSAKIFSADKEHLHHRLLASGLSQKRVVFLLFLSGLGIASVGMFAAVYAKRAIGLTLLAFVTLFYLVVKHVIRSEFWDSGKLFLGGLKRPSSRILSALLLPPIDLLILTLAVMFSTAILNPGIEFVVLKSYWFGSFPIWVTIPFIVIASTWNL